MLSGIRNGYLDAGFYVEPNEDQSDLTTVELSRFNVYLAGAPEYAGHMRDGDLTGLQDVPCICPPDRSCYGRMAEKFFEERNFHPRRIINVDDEVVARTLIADGVGIGVIHAPLPPDERIVVLSEVRSSVRIVFGYLAERAEDPVIGVIREILGCVEQKPEPQRATGKCGKLPRLVRKTA